MSGSRVHDDQTFHDAIEAYAGQLSYESGAMAVLHVSTTSATYRVEIERWGRRRDLVWERDGIAGVHHAVPDDADAHGCGWPGAVEIDTTGLASGFYLATLTADGAASDRAVNHACFVVRAAADARGSVLYVLPTNTWHAYNTWGGRSLYTGGTQVSFARPFGRGILCRPEVERDDRKARPVRFREDPDADGQIFQAYRTANHYPAAIGSTGWFTHGRRFVEWAEHAGFSLGYAVSSDLESDASLTEGYDLIVLVGHDEYWSAGQRASIERHVERGGNVASFSGNTSFWQVRIEAGERGPAMVCHKYRAHLDDPVLADEPVRMAGMWADPVVGRPEWELFGAGSAFGLYHRFGKATARGVGGFIVARDGHWIFAETGLGYGDVVGVDDGVVGYETVGCPLTFDALQQPVAAAHPGLPDEIEIVGFCPSSNLRVGEYPASISALTDQGDLEFIADRVFASFGDHAQARARHGNAVMLTCRPFGSTGGEVTTIGSTDWVFGLAHDSTVGRITSNVLSRYSN